MKKFSTATPWFTLQLLLASCFIPAAATPASLDAPQEYQSDVNEIQWSVSSSPRIRYLPQPGLTLSPIGARQILPFLEPSLGVTAEELGTAPQIIAGQDGRVILGPDDRIYVHGEIGGDGMFQIFHPAQALIDPLTKEVLAHDAVWLGTARLQSAARSKDELHIFIITDARQEIGIGNLLLPMARGVEKVAADYFPHAPTVPVDARIISMRSGVDQSGQHQIVILNKGAADKIDQGTILNVYGQRRAGGRQDGNNAGPQLPERLTATMLILKVSERIAYGLIMQATEPVFIGDRVGWPG